MYEMHNQAADEKLLVYRADDDAVLAHHFHNAYEIILIEEGAADFVIAGNRAVFGRGEIVFLNNLETHEMHPRETPYVRYVMIVSPEYFDRFIGEQALGSILKQRPSGFRHGVLLEGVLVEQAGKLMRECLREYEDNAPHCGAAVMANLLRLLIMLYRSRPECFPSSITSRYQEEVSRIQSYIDQNCREDLTLALIGSVFHINKYHLTRIFKEVTGYTVGQYIVLGRVSHAKNLLCYTGWDVGRVAMESGFNSASNFIRAFNRAEGMTPLRFRKLYHNG